MATETLFLQQFEGRFDAAAVGIAATIDRHLDEAKGITVCRITREEIMESVPHDMRGIIAQAIPERIAALKFTSSEQPGRLHAAWLTRAMLDAERSYGCTVAVKIGKWYIRKSQFAETESEIRVVAAGDDPKNAVLYVRDEERRFDLAFFDKDGYVKMA